MKIESLNKISDITIGIDITTLCNYNCDYCYAMDRYNDDWQQDNDISILIRSLKLIQLNKSITINILGGEPTLSKNLFEIYELAKLKNVKMNLFTNFSKPISFWEKHDFSLLNNIDISFHVNEIDKNFFDRIYKMLNINNNITLRVMLNLKNDSEEFKERYFKKLLILKKYIKIELDYIVYSGEDQLVVFKQCLNKYDYLYEEFSRNLKIDNQIILEKDILKYFTNTRNMICHQNQYVITTNNKIIDICSSTEFNIVEFIKHIKTINCLKCEHDFCPCFNFLENTKVHKNEKIK